MNDEKQHANVPLTLEDLLTTAKQLVLYLLNVLNITPRANLEVSSIHILGVKYFNTKL